MNKTDTSPKGFSTAAGEGEAIWFVADTLTLKATAASTGGSYTVVECLTSPGGGPPPHVHTSEDEFWYVLDGTFEIHIGDEVLAIGPGGFAFGHAARRTTSATPRQPRAGFSWPSRPAGSRISSASPVSPRPTTAPRRRSTRPKSPA